MSRPWTDPNGPREVFFAFRLTKIEADALDGMKPVDIVRAVIKDESLRDALARSLKT